MKPKPTADSAAPDLTPMVDVIFLLILFFLLAGRISDQWLQEGITVPPSRTGEKDKPDPRWHHVIIEAIRPPGTRHTTIRCNGGPSWIHEPEGTPYAYVNLREVLDDAHVHADDYEVRDGLQLKKVMVQLRADADVEHRVVQELLQLIADSVDPADGSPRPPRRPFVDVRFSVRHPADREG